MKASCPNTHIFRRGEYRKKQRHMIFPESEFFVFAFAACPPPATPAPTQPPATEAPATEAPTAVPPTDTAVPAPTDTAAPPSPTPPPAPVCDKLADAPAAPAAGALAASDNPIVITFVPSGATGNI